MWLTAPTDVQANYLQAPKQIEDADEIIHVLMNFLHHATDYDRTVTRSSVIAFPILSL